MARETGPFLLEKLFKKRLDFHQKSGNITVKIQQSHRKPTANKGPERDENTRARQTHQPIPSKSGET
jgi:hypothetical protein